MPQVVRPPLDQIRVGPADTGKILFDHPSDASTFSGLGKLNLLVGPNNSGKSRVLRALARGANSLTFRPSPPEVGHWFTRVGDFMAGLRKADISDFKSGSKPDITPVPGELKSIDPEAPQRVLNLLKACVEGFPAPVPMHVRDRPAWQQHELWRAAEGLLTLTEQLKFEFPPPAPSFYISGLRGARRLSDAPDLKEEARTALLGQDLYAHQTKVEQFPQIPGTHTPEVATGYLLYQRLQELLLGKYDERTRVSRYEEMLGARFFGGQRVTLIPRVGETQVYVKVGREAERRLADLGDGLQQVVILTYDAFFELEPRLFFVEEPELFLHPGMVRAVCEYYLETPHTFFVATHSNHLLDLTWDRDDVRIFRVSKKPLADGESVEPVVAVDPASRLKTLLGDLGVRATSLFLANAVIWVEGPTDHRYLGPVVRAELERQGRKLHEGLHYVFAYYAGANVKNWTFAESPIDSQEKVAASRLAASSMVIADKDGPKSKEWRDAPLRAELGDSFVLTSGREIENELPPEVIWNVVLDYEGTTTSLPRVVPFDHNAYAAEPLGHFLQNKVKEALNGVPPRRESYCDGEGPSLKDKDRFATKALQYLDCGAPGPNLGRLAKLIADFVVAQNKLPKAP